MMGRPYTLRLHALAALRSLITARTKSEAARLCLTGIDPDTWGNFRAPLSATESAMVKAIDVGLGGAGGIAEYLLYECERGPGCVEFPEDGTVYPIATIDDLQRLLAERYPLV